MLSKHSRTLPTEMEKDSSGRVIRRSQLKERIRQKIAGVEHKPCCEILVNPLLTHDLNGCFNGSNIAFLKNHITDPSVVNAEAVRYRGGVTVAQYRNSLSCLQSIVKLNLHESKGEFILFCNKDGQFCNVGDGIGLEKTTGNELDIDALERKHGFVPLNTINASLIFVDEMARSGVPCTRCKRNLLIPVGLSANLKFVAAQCVNCDRPDDVPSISFDGKEKFVRLITSCDDKKHRYRIELPPIQSHYEDVTDYMYAVKKSLHCELGCILEHQRKSVKGYIVYTTLDELTNSDWIGIEVQVDASERLTQQEIEHFPRVSVSLPIGRNEHKDIEANIFFHSKQQSSQNFITICLVVPRPTEDLQTIPISKHGVPTTLTFRNTPRSMEKICEKLNKTESCSLNIFQQVIVNPAALNNVTATTPDCHPLLPQTLTSMQEKATINSMSYPISLLYGPSGTGKTTVVASCLISSWLKHPEQRTVCILPTHRSQRTMIETLHKVLEDYVKVDPRVGEFRVLCMLGEDHEALLEPKDLSAGNGNIVFLNRMVDEVVLMQKNLPMSKYVMEINNGRLCSHPELGLKQYFQQRRQLEKDYMANEQFNCVIGTSADIISGRLGQDVSFENVVLDDAGLIPQVEVFCLAEMAKEKLILCGDWQQVQQYVGMESVRCAGYPKSALENLYVSSCVTSFTLTEQFRSNPILYQFITELGYPTVKPNPVMWIRDEEEEIINNTLGTNNPLVIVDYVQENRQPGEWRQNSFECEVVANICKKLLTAGYNRKNIGISAVFHTQVELLNKSLTDHGVGIHADIVEDLAGRNFQTMFISMMDVGDFTLSDYMNRFLTLVGRPNSRMIFVANRVSNSTFPLFRLMENYGEIIKYSEL